MLPDWRPFNTLCFRKYQEVLNPIGDSGTFDGNRKRLNALLLDPKLQ